MKRNLLIGTSLVAAFSATSLDARSFSVMTEEARKDNTALSSAIHIVTEGAKRSTSKTPLKAGSTDAFVAAYKAAEAMLLPGAEDGKVTLAAVTAELAKNPGLRKLVAEHRKQVELQVQADKPVNPTPAPVVEPTPAPEPTPVVVPGPTDVVTFGELTKDFEDSKTDLETAINQEAAARADAKAKAADVTAATTTKTAADKALSDAQTAAKAAAEKAAVAKTAVQTAANELTALDEKHKVELAKVPAVTDAAKDKAADSAEVLNLTKLTADIKALEASIAIATRVKAHTADALKDADAQAAQSAKDVETLTAAQTAAVKALEAAVKAETEAKEAVTAKTAAVTEATLKLATAKTTVLAAAQKAATEAAEKAKAATAVANAAEMKKTELATAAESAKAKVVELGKRKTAAERELATARRFDGADSTDATKAEVKAKEAAVEAVLADLEKAKQAVYHAEQAEKAAVNTAAKATSDAEKATTAKKAADADLTAAQELVDASEKAITALKASVVQKVAAEAAAAQAKKAAAEAKTAAGKEVTLTGELSGLQEKLAIDQENPALKKAVADKEAELTQAKKEAETTALAEKNATAAAEAETAKRVAAEQAAEQAKLDARTLNDKLVAESKLRVAAEAKAAAFEAASSKFAIEVSTLTAAVDAADADKVLVTIIGSVEAKLKAAQAKKDVAQRTVDALLAEIKPTGYASEGGEAAEISLAEAMKSDDKTVADIQEEFAEMVNPKSLEKLASKKAEIDAMSDNTAEEKAAIDAMSDNTAEEKAAKTKALTEFNQAKEFRDNLVKLFTAIDALNDVELAVELETATANLSKAQKLKALMDAAKVEAKGSYSSIMAEQLNAEITKAKKLRAVELDAKKASPDQTISTAIESFEALGRAVECFNEVKALVDLDVTSKAAKAAANPAIAERNALIAELQYSLDASNLSAVTNAQSLVAVMTARFYGLDDTLARVQSGPSDYADRFTDAVRSHLRRLDAALNAFAKASETLVGRIVRAAAPAGSLSLSSGSVLEGHKEGDEKVQNLTADAMKGLKSALAPYNTFLNNVAPQGDISLLSEDELNSVFGTRVEGSSDMYVNGSAAKNLEAFKARTKLELLHVHRDLEVFGFQVQTPRQAMNFETETEYSQTKAELEQARNDLTTRVNAITVIAEADRSLVQASELAVLTAKLGRADLGLLRELNKAVAVAHRAIAAGHGDRPVENTKLTRAIEAAVNVILSPAPEPTPPASEHDEEGASAPSAGPQGGGVMSPPRGLPAGDGHSRDGSAAAVRFADETAPRGVSGAGSPARRAPSATAIGDVSSPERFAAGLDAKTQGINDTMAKLRADRAAKAAAAAKK